MYKAMSDSHFVDEAFKELKDKGMATVKDVQNLRDSVIEANFPNEDEKKQALDFLEHLNTCTDKNCNIHKSKTDLQNNAWARGFLSGVQVGKKARR